MTNNQRKKLAAQQHNDAIDYERWLIANTINQERRINLTRQRSKLAGVRLSSMVVLAMASTCY
jgi:hypothetical protein